jgi:ATP-dependent RNA helicase HelY
VRLTDRRERDEFAATVDTLLGDLPDADLRVLGYDRWRAALLDGIAAHHAGMVPAFKEAVEVLFQRGLLKVVEAGPRPSHPCAALALSSRSTDRMSSRASRFLP